MGVALAAGGLAAANPSAAAEPASARPAAGIARVSAAAAQRVDGIGASGAWWVNDLVRFPPEVQRRVADLLFGPDGIQLSAYRYNIGGGGTGVNPGDRAPQTPLVSPGTYDWSRDPGGTTFLRYAAEHGVEDLLAFVNSAPAVWKSNGKSCGGQLNQDNVDDFANYVADVVGHHRSEGIDLDYVSPMNEPTNTFEECGQEGMAVPVAQRDDIVRAVGETLAARGLDVGITADESSSTAGFATEVPQWTASGDAARYVSRLAHHTYNFPDDAGLRAAADVGRALGRPTWASEICCFAGIGQGWGQQYDPTIVNALAMADIIHRDFTRANSSAFHWWTALSKMVGCDTVANPSCVNQVNSAGWNDGLIYYDPSFATTGNSALYPTKRLYVLGQYSKFVRPGAVRHEVSGTPNGIEISAFEREGTWTLVANNLTTSQSTVDVSIDGLPAPAAIAAYRTSASENLARVTAGTVNANAVSFTLPARSVTTYVITRG